MARGTARSLQRDRKSEGESLAVTKSFYTLMVRCTLLVIRSPLPGGGNQIMRGTWR